jgi:hypothetical protein
MGCFGTFTLKKGKNQINPREFMILNKFSRLSLSGRLTIYSLQLFALSLFSCNKTANITGNKAYIGLTHVAYGVGSLNMTLDGDSLMSQGIPFGTTTGTPGFPYDTAVSRVSEVQLVGDSVLLQGNSIFQQNAHYSIFAYDSLDIKSIALLTLQDYTVTPIDSLSYFRFLNFSPGSQIGLKMIYVEDFKINDSVTIFIRDTVVIPASLFVGYNPGPSNYPIKYSAHIGNNQIFAWVDSSRPRIDSSNFRRMTPIQFDSTKSYNLYLEGYFNPSLPKDSLQLKSVRLN